jgi:hypothetical protein
MAGQAARGRTLKLFLVDGTPTGVITAELGNWSGKALVAPRASLPDLIKRPEASRSGVYLLMGPDPDAAERNLIYVGESDSVRDRLAAHDADENRQFFTRVCLVVSKDENLTKAHGRYLESRLIELIRSAKRANLQNGTEPPSKGLPESEVADMEGFLAEIEVLLPVLGFDVLRPAAQAAPGDAQALQDPLMFTFTEAGTNARAKEVAGEFVVLAGSLARASETNTCPHGIKVRRQQLLEEGALVLVTDGERYRFTRDVAFGSPSGAGALVYGGSVNGRFYWREEISGKSYGELRGRVLAAAQEQ